MVPVKLKYNKKNDRLQLEFYFQLGLTQSSENMRAGEIETSVPARTEVALSS